MKHFLWCGVIVRSEAVANFKVVSAAANNWQLGFINGLISNGCNVTCISYLADSYWPKGKILPNLKANEVPDNLNVIRVSYFNFPFLRELSLGLSLIFVIIKYNISFNVLITYNPFKRHIFLGKFVKFWLNKIWLLIIADGDYNGSPDLSLYLSHETFLSKNGNKYFLQGGIAEFIPLTSSQVFNRNVVYAGNISKLTGIVEFATLFNQIDFDRMGLELFELHIYGKGEDKLLNSLASINPRIKVFGFVQDELLKIAMQEAWLFVNPRNLMEESIQNTFPSKILEYIRYGKPIISTKSRGISDKYDAFLFYYESENLMSLLDTFYKIESFDEKSRIEIGETAMEFCNSNSWKNITSKFLMEFKDLI